MLKAIRIKLVRSPAGRVPKHRATVKGLGLRHTEHERVLEDTPAVRGMIKAVPYLVEVIEEGLPIEAARRG